MNSITYIGLDVHTTNYTICAYNIENDKIRTEYLESKGYKVLRFWNNEIYENIEGVLKRLESEINPLQEL